MVRAAAGGLAIFGKAAPLALGILLQRRLGVGRWSFRRNHERPPELAHNGLRRREAAIHVDRAQDRLARIGEDHGLLPSAGARLARRHDKLLPKLKRVRDIRAAALADERVIMPGEFNLAGLRKLHVKQGGDRKAQDAVAQEFQPLIVMPAMAGARAGMGERLGQQALVRECIAEPGFKLVYLRFFRWHLVDRVSGACLAQI